jgi:eukaryotic-like serine/threonine-protein kinase
MTHPQRLGKYRITEVLGEGAMGVVYKGFDPDIQRVVALKTIRRQPGASAEHAAMAGARFRNEAQAAGRLLHPGIVAVYEYGDDAQVAFIAMEYVEGSSLARYLSHGVRFSDEDILSLVVQLLDALEHAHSQGVWHRDIKPSNLVVTRAGKLKVADFGIARIDSLELTQTNMVIGTPSHMAPEQYLSGPIDRRVDIYAAGALMYQLLAGQPPFSGSPESLMYKALNEVPAPPSQVDPAGRPALHDAIVAKAMSKDPAQRYASAAEFRAAVMATVGEPVLDAVSDKTLIMQPLQQHRPATASPSGANAFAQSSGAGPVWTTAAPSGWDPATLSQIEASLARHVGPIARVLVRRAARECSDSTTLRQRLAEHVPDPVERASFIGHVATKPPRADAGRTEPGLDSGAFIGAAALSVSTIEQAQRELARHIGPIAKVVVKQAAAQAAGREDFFARLAESIPDALRRERFLSELSRVV